MQTPTITIQQPLSQRLWAWMLERYPPPNWVGFYLLYLSAALWARSAVGPCWLSLYDLVGFVVTNAYFLLLRTLDEHKDYAADCDNHPERVLQRGLITLGHLKVVAGLCVVLQVAWNLYLDGGLGAITQVWLITMVWTSLMAKEFFCKAYLEKRLVLYAASHMVVLFPALLWLLHMGVPGTPLHLDRGRFLLMCLAFTVSAIGEVTRKTRAPDEEREGVDSYTKALGLSGTVGVLACGLLLSAGLTWGLLHMRGAGVSWVSWVMSALVLGSVLQASLGLKTFLSQAILSTRKKLEKGIALHLMLLYLVLLTSILTSCPSIIWRLW